MTAPPNTIPAPSAPMVDDNGVVTQVWWQFLLSMFNKQGGGGDVPDFSQIIAQLNAATDGVSYLSTQSPDPQSALDALRGVDELRNEIRNPENLSLILNRLSDLERLLHLQPDLPRLLAKLEEIEGALADIRPAYQPIVEQWKTPTLINSWVAYVSPFNPPSYYRDPFGIVRLRWMVKSGTIGQDIFVLPAGYRPANVEIFPNVSNSLFGIAEITSTGSVNATSGNNAYFSLDGMTFRAAQ